MQWPIAQKADSALWLKESKISANSKLSSKCLYVMKQGTRNVQYMKKQRLQISWDCSFKYSCSFRFFYVLLPCLIKYLTQYFHIYFISRLVNFRTFALDLSLRKQRFRIFFGFRCDKLKIICILGFRENFACTNLRKKPNKRDLSTAHVGAIAAVASSSMYGYRTLASGGQQSSNIYWLQRCDYWFS